MVDDLGTILGLFGRAIKQGDDEAKRIKAAGPRNVRELVNLLLYEAKQ